MDKVLELKNVYFSYNGEDVLENISFELTKNEILGIIGPNGSGKSTLLKIITGILRPRVGEVHLYTNRVSYIPQKATSFKRNFPATVEEIVALGRLGTPIYRRLSNEDYKLIDSALERVGMVMYKKRRIGELSGGQQQRVFIARTIVSNPELLVLDEPTTGVDINAQTQFYNLLGELNRDMNITIIIVSHDVSAVASEVTRLAYLNKKLHFIGRPQEFYKKVLWPLEIEELLRKE
ncbi:MAG: metal ABC transporter ATP-binding protein [bacterium]